MNSHMCKACKKTCSFILSFFYSIVVTSYTRIVPNVCWRHVFHQPADLIVDNISYISSKRKDEWYTKPSNAEIKNPFFKNFLNTF